MQATTNSALAAIAGFNANLLLAAQSIAKLEHAIISRNTPLNLPPRVGIIYMPDRNPSKIFTSPAKVDRSFASWETQPAGTEPAPISAT